MESLVKVWYYDSDACYIRYSLNGRRCLSPKWHTSLTIYMYVRCKPDSLSPVRTYLASPWLAQIHVDLIFAIIQVNKPITL